MKILSINKFYQSLILTLITALVMMLSSFIAFQAQPVSAVAGDGATSNIQLLDTNANGKMNRITLDIANPNGETWQAVGASPYGFSVTQQGNDVTIASVSITSAATANPVQVEINLDESDNDLFVDSNAVTSGGNIELIYTQATGDHTCNNCLNDSTDEELNGIATGDSGATDTEIDAAAPVVYRVDYVDNNDDLVDSDGKVDGIAVWFSENVDPASVLSANDIVITNAGDFTGLSLGTSTTDLITGSTNNIEILGAAASGAAQANAYDTFDDSGNFAVSTQNGFSLTDGTNTNTTLGALTGITVIDRAAPVISSFTYEDTDEDFKIDQVTVGFTETVIGASSTLSANNLLFTNVGDFTGAAFGADATDLLTTNVSSIAVPLGTEATVQDTSEDSGNIAISTQNNPNLRDLADNIYNSNTAQSQATFIDGAFDGGHSPGFKEAINNPVIETGETITDDFQEDTLNEEEIQQIIDQQEEVPPVDEDIIVEEAPVEFGKDLMGNDLMMGSLVMVDGHPAIYYVDSQAMRHVFPRETVYRSWYGLDFSMVVMVDANTLASMELGDPVPYAPGTMIKIPSVPKVYLLTGNREMRHIASEQVAMDIFGAEWNTMIKDVSEAFFVQYTDLEMAITSADQVDLEGLMQAGPTIDSELY